MSWSPPKGTVPGGAWLAFPPMNFGGETGYETGDFLLLSFKII